MGDGIRGIETWKVDNVEERNMGGTDLTTLRRGGEVETGGKKVKVIIKEHKCMAYGHEQWCRD